MIKTNIDFTFPVYLFIKTIMAQCHFLNLQELNTTATNETSMKTTNNIYSIPFVETNLTRCPCRSNMTLFSSLLFSLFFFFFFLTKVVSFS